MDLPRALPTDGPCPPPPRRTLERERRRLERRIAAAEATLEEYARYVEVMRALLGAAPG